MKHAKPFLKWAGGKTQLLADIRQSLPAGLHAVEFDYVEPFVGSGAVLFWMLNHFPNIRKAIINDVNADLVNTYRVIAQSPEELIEQLGQMQEEYYALSANKEAKQLCFYAKRAQFNLRNSGAVEQAALFIFLNRTCFNGLYRVNRDNQFNVPMGSYKRPTICDADNLRAVNRLLQKVEIRCGDFAKTRTGVRQPAFFYFDPPYKPLSQTSSFNSYARDEFNDKQQIRLRDFCAKLDKLGHRWMLSNSDVRGQIADGEFFDTLYADFRISRVKATRRINSNASKRGELNELLITNYEPESIVTETAGN